MAARHGGERGNGIREKEAGKPGILGFPFLVTIFEGGMLGYALFGLLYPGQIRLFAIAFVTAPVSGLILVIVGYELSFQRKMLRPMLTTAALIYFILPPPSPIPCM